MNAEPRRSRRAPTGSRTATRRRAQPIPTTFATVSAIAVDRIDVPPRPARRMLGDIASLADSMQDYGLQQPISVRASADRYILTSGLRRLAAARMLRWTTIPAFVRTVDADHAYLLDLVENLQREDLSPEEEADALSELIRTRGWTQQQVADGIKRSVGYVSKRIRVFEDPLLRSAIVDRGLPVSTAEELLAADDAQRPMLIERALTEGWDQVRARQGMRDLDSSGQGIVDLPPPQRQSALEPDPRQEADELPAGRPRGFTRVIREFHDMIKSVEATHLTDADRGALRALFRDLTMLARASTTRQAPVFPPLPASEPRRGPGTRSRK
jgi:ParB/RepB/Spo0J family partition protein